MSVLKYKDANGNWQYATSYHQVTSTGGITPTGELEILENGTYDVTEYASALVNVASSGGAVETITASGNLPHAFAGDVWGDVFKQFPNLIEVNRLQDANCMFWKNSTIKRIPFVLNTASDATVNFTQAFYGCTALEEPPVISAGTRISAVRAMFSDCYKLKTFPEGYGADWNWDEFKGNSYADCSALFYNCYSLRKAPQALLDNAFAGVGTSNNYVGYYNGFASCYNLDEVLNLGVNQGSLTSNRMGYMFSAAYCIKRFTFATNADGTPKTAKWKNQTLELQNLGFCNPTYSWQIDDITNNCPERAGKRIYDDATYAALKNDPDAWTGDATNNNTCYHWSLYNKASALETIKSLPDCSATGTNTIKFRGEAGLKTDGGAINTMTDAEIAVAAAKGWTVSFV
jgi:hypothetical protein